MPIPSRLGGIVPLLKPIPGASDQILVDLVRQILGGSKRHTEQLGENLVSNGDFHDFTLDVAKYNPVAYWVFDDYYHAQESTGKTIIQDLSGNGHDLTASIDFDYANQMTGSNPAYKGGRAVEFDGLDDYFYIPAEQASAFNPSTGNFTIAARAYIKKMNDFQVIAEKWGGTQVYRIQVNNNSLSVRFAFGDTAIEYHTVDIAVTAGWHHFVLVRDGLELRIYVDGVLEQSITFTTLVDVSPTADLTIGARYNNTVHFASNISEVAYFNRALTDQEAKEISGLAKGWTWDGVGSVSNSNFQQVVSGGGTISQTITQTAGKLHKITVNGSLKDYSTASSYNIQLSDGTYSYVRDQEVLNASWSGTTVNDYSGNGNHGTMYGGMEANMLGNGYWLPFDGVDDYVNFGNVVNPGTDNFLIMAWIKTETASSGQNQNIVDKRDAALSAGGKGFSMTLDYLSTKLAFGLGDGTHFVSTATVIGFKELNDNKPHFVGVFVDRDNGIAYGLVDGAQERTTDISTVTGSIDNTSDLVLGTRSFDKAAEWFTGNIGIVFPVIVLPNATLNYAMQLYQNIYNATKNKYLET